MAILLLLGLSLMILAPLFRRFNAASWILAAGAFLVIALALNGIAHPDLRSGQAAVESNRRQYLFLVECELPPFILALISWKRFKWAFWLGWGINVAVSLFILIVIVWVEFFWHW